MKASSTLEKACNCKCKVFSRSVRQSSTPFCIPSIYQLKNKIILLIIELSPQNFVGISIQILVRKYDNIYRSKKQKNTIIKQHTCIHWRHLSYEIKLFKSKEKEKTEECHSSNHKNKSMPILRDKEEYFLVRWNYDIVEKQMALFKYQDTNERERKGALYIRNSKLVTSGNRFIYPGLTASLYGFFLWNFTRKLKART